MTRCPTSQRQRGIRGKELQVVGWDASSLRNCAPSTLIFVGRTLRQGKRHSQNGKKKKETRCDIKNRFQSRHLQAPSQILTREIFRGLPRECVHLQSWETILDKPLHLDLNFRIPGVTGLISQPFRVIFGALSLQAQLSSQNKPQSWFCYICLE